MISFKKFYEKNVIGISEVIYIDGIGEVVAKVDSGNSAFNVLHGTDIDVRNNNVSFKTVNNTFLTRPVKSTITINVGAGHTEDRPVVELDVKVGVKKFNGVKFSISDRSTNENPVLICKDFIMNQLDALIDVNGKNLASKDIEVNY